MSSRDGGPDVPEESPRPADDGVPEDNDLPEVPGAGATAFDVENAAAPRRRRRTRITLVAAATLALLMVVLVAVPTTRNGLLDLWCDATGGVCPGDPLPPITEDEEIDWRVRVEPEEAALWGNYVSLGDSYSSGDGAGDYDPETAEPGECWRSENAYPKLIEQEFDFEGALAFYACSSHRGAQMLDQIGTPESQLERVTENTSLVTVGIGGNDLGFIPVLRTCIVRMPLLERSACTDQEDEVTEKMDEFEDTLTEVLTEIRDRAPDARVLVLGYPRLFPEEPPGMYYTLSTGDQLWLNTVAQRFNERIRDTAFSVDGEVYGSRQVGSVEYVNVFSALSGHEVSEENAWLNGIVLGELGEGLRVDRASFHPTAEGQRSIAERVRLQIVEGPERVLYQSRDRLEAVSAEQLTRELGGPLDPVHEEAHDEAGDEPDEARGEEEAAEAGS
ncbi:SGNH/GDSL hydrolase family protein [Nocardiopsis sp. MG754419]|uniref:SGNH/GDSL hydrolase family protein n=1 Tax=Nocardiopsis sp. MG754419 TaxID=2259865 RepID=UPI001BACBA2E|nr:SGNH/GDSL hydrolase family protein [Nocardiopsis sp. MG754419]MBR8740688.1 SGNH/GDSL hydrolase family protein [Nocardiopsis sp. MG754419]